MQGLQLKKLLKGVLAGIKPSISEINEERHFARDIVSRLSRVTKTEVVITGSIAKGTFLKGNNDIDIFVLFQKNVDRKNFEKIIRAVVNRAFPKKRYVVSYAEHPYVRLHTGGRRVDIVPAYKISKASELRSAVDRSVLHTKFIKMNMSKRQLDDVLLLKKFLKSNELYGAEIRVQGISGYLCELLILHYRTFLGLIRKVAKWQPPVFIDIKGHYSKTSIRPAASRFNRHLIVIDPVDSERNVAAAVSKENVKWFILLARKFLSGPCRDFFERETSFLERLRIMRKRKGSIYLLEMEKPAVVDDILWGQIRKLERQLCNHLEKNGFKVLETHADSDERVTLALRIACDSLPDKKLLAGPITSLTENVKEFRNAHKNARFVIRNKRIYAHVKRTITHANAAILLFLRTAILPSHLNKGISFRKY